MNDKFADFVVTWMLVLGGFEALVLVLFMLGAGYFFFQLFRPKSHHGIEAVNRLKERHNKEQGNGS
jgi:hypothetical protein